jgi:N-acetylmuramoyl-L-alanine amidase
MRSTSNGSVTLIALLAVAAPFTAASLPAHAQASAPTRHAAKASKPAPAGHFLVLLDPGHGGADPGASLGPNSPEKTAALAFALRLRDALTAKGIEVRLTRDSDTNLSSDQRGEISASAQPGACVSLHLASSSAGVHIFTALPAPPADAGFVPWTQIQSEYLHQSTLFAATLQTALKASGLPAFLAPASLPTLERFHCPAVAIELAPSTASASTTPVAISLGILAWRTQWTRMRAAP